MDGHGCRQVVSGRDVCSSSNRNRNAAHLGCCGSNVKGHAAGLASAFQSPCQPHSKSGWSSPMYWPSRRSFTEPMCSQAEFTLAKVWSPMDRAPCRPNTTQWLRNCWRGAQPGAPGACCGVPCPLTSGGCFPGSDCSPHESCRLAASGGALPRPCPHPAAAGKAERPRPPSSVSGGVLCVEGCLLAPVRHVFTGPEGFRGAGEHFQGDEHRGG